MQSKKAKSVGVLVAVLLEKQLGSCLKGYLGKPGCDKMENLIEKYKGLLADNQEKINKGIADSHIEDDSEENRTKLAILESEVSILNDVIQDLNNMEMKNVMKKYNGLLADKQKALRKLVSDLDVKRKGQPDSEENRIKLAVSEEVHILCDVIRDLKSEERTK